MINFISITHFLGDSKTLQIPMIWEGAAFTPAGEWDLIFTAKHRATDTDADAVFQKQSGAGITESGSTANVALISQDTINLNPGILLCDVQATNLTTGAVRTVALSRLNLKRDITRASTVTLPIYTTEPGGANTMRAPLILSDVPVSGAATSIIVSGGVGTLAMFNGLYKPMGDYTPGGRIARPWFYKDAGDGPPSTPEDEDSSGYKLFYSSGWVFSQAGSDYSFAQDHVDTVDPRGVEVWSDPFEEGSVLELILNPVTVATSLGQEAIAIIPGLISGSTILIFKALQISPEMIWGPVTPGLIFDNGLITGVPLWSLLEYTGTGPVYRTGPYPGALGGNLGMPNSGDLSHCSNLPLVGGVTGTLPQQNMVSSYSIGNANSTLLGDIREIFLTASLTEPRSYTLPPAANYPPGGKLYFADIVGGISASNTATFVANGGVGNTIDGASSITAYSPGACRMWISDGVSKWQSDQSIPRKGSPETIVSAWTYTANQTWNGTNNFAPNQTAASGASLMTRDLGDVRYAKNGYHMRLTRASPGYSNTTFQNSTLRINSVPAGKYILSAYIVSNSASTTVGREITIYNPVNGCYASGVSITNWSGSPYGMAAPSQTILINSDAVGQTIGVIYSTSANAATWYSKIDTIIDLPSTQDIICKVKQTSNDASNPIYLNYGTQMALTRIA